MRGKRRQESQAAQVCSGVLRCAQAQLVPMSDGKTVFLLVMLGMEARASYMVGMLYLSLSHIHLEHPPHCLNL